MVSNRHFVGGSGLVRRRVVANTAQPTIKVGSNALRNFHSCAIGLLWVGWERQMRERVEMRAAPLEY